MNTRQSVEALCSYSLPESAASVLEPFRSEQKSEEPAQRCLRLWYESQEPEGREITELLVQFSVAAMLFSLLVVLDNADVVESGDAKGQFALFYTKDGFSTRLGEFPDLLHDNLPDFESLVAAAKPRP